MICDDKSFNYLFLLLLFFYFLPERRLILFQKETGTKCRCEQESKYPRYFSLYQLVQMLVVPNPYYPAQFLLGKWQSG